MRLRDTSLVSGETGQKAKISVLKTFPLMAPGQRASTAQPYTRTRPSKNGLGSSNDQTMVARRPTSRDRVAPLSVPVSEIVKFKNWAEDAIVAQQSDIERISGTVNRIEEDMRSLKEYMLEIRRELSSRQLPAISVEDDVQALREDLENVRKHIVRSGEAVSTRSFELVSREVEEIGQRVNDVDHLKSELQKMTARVEHLEGIRRPAPYSEPPSIDAEPYDEPISGPSKRKIKEREEYRNVSREELPHKRRKHGLTSRHINDHNIATNSEKSPDCQPAQHREIIEIFSSEDDPSAPARGEEEKHLGSASSEDTEDNSIPAPASDDSPPVRGTGSGQRPIPMSLQEKPPTPAPASRPVPASRIEIRIPYSPALAVLQSKASRAHAATSFDDRTSQHSSQQSDTFNRENLAPTTEADDDHNARESSSGADHDPEADEQDSTAHVVHSADSRFSTIVTKPSGGDCRKDDEVVNHNSQCEKCKKTYSIVQGLEYVCTPEADLSQSRVLISFLASKVFKVQLQPDVASLG